MRKLFVFIDGSCIDIKNKEKAIGGWAYKICDRNFKVLKEDHGKIRKGQQDSVRAELEALYQALLNMKSFKGNTKFHIYTDYDVIVDCLNGFSDRKANRDYWNLIEPLCLSLNGRFRVDHIKSHQELDGDMLKQLNFEVDKLARAGANSLIKVPVAI